MQCLQRIGPVASDISDVAFDPKGQLLTAACPNRIQIYSMTTLQGTKYQLLRHR